MRFRSPATCACLPSRPRHPQQRDALTDECRSGRKKARWLLVAVATSFAAIAIEAAEPTKHVDIPMRLHEGYSSEHCAEFAARAVLEYTLETPSEVDFNIHHHAPTETVYPVKARVGSRYSGKLELPHAGQYCFQWRNLADQSADFSIRLNYTVSTP